MKAARQGLRLTPCSSPRGHPCASRGLLALVRCGRCSRPRDRARIRDGRGFRNIRSPGRLHALQRNGVLLVERCDPVSRRSAAVSGVLRS